MRSLQQLHRKANSLFFCSKENDNFGNIRNPDDWDDFEPDNDEAEVINTKEATECPVCGGDAYWTGSCYECDECGLCSNQDDD